MAKRGLTAISVAQIKPREKRFEVPDGGCAGLYLQVQPSGAKRWAVRSRLDGKPTKFTLAAGLGLKAARAAATELLHKVEQGIDPRAEKQAAKAAAEVRAGNTLRAVAESHLRFEEAKPADKRLRTIGQRRAVFERLIFPKLGGLPVAQIKRSEIVRLLDNVLAERGPRMADEVLSVLSILFTWHAKRTDDFHSPIVRGMNVTTPKSRARNRILTDDELRHVWVAADRMGTPYGAFVKFLLLTATRRNEAARMVWSEVHVDDWTIPARRYKTGLDHVVPLSAKARALLDEMPRFPDSDFVFTLDGRFPISEFSHGKRKLDKASGVTGWRLHDLRRQARTLLGRAGINGEIGERCLGHVPGGVRGVYDRFEYRDQKAQAFEQLAALIDRIVSPPDGDNIVQLRA